LSTEASTPIVALLGATGTVGRSFVTWMAEAGLGRLRLGVRDATAVDGAHEVITVDLSDRASLDAFIEGAAVLANCLGPAYRTRGRIASAALRAGVPYLDPGCDDTMHERIRQSMRQPVEIPMLTGVGSVPGVCGLLARWLAGGMPAPVESITGFVLTIEPIHAGTATEFLLNMLDKRATAPAPAGNGVRLPCVDRPLVAHAFASGEIESLSEDLKLREAAFYHAFEAGGAVLAALERIPARLQEGAGIRDLAADLAAVVNEDMAGKPPLHMLSYEVRAGSAVRSAVLRSSSSYRLTALLAVLATREILARRVPPGVSRAGVLPPGLVTELPALDRETHLEIRDTRLDSWFNSH
jgi:hypothetical protein